MNKFGALRVANHSAFRIHSYTDTADTNGVVVPERFRARRARIDVEHAYSTANTENDSTLLEWPK